MSRGQAPQTVGRVCSSQGLAMVEKNKGSVSLQSKFLRDSVNNRLQNLYNKYNTKFSRFRAQNYRNDKPSSEGNDRLKNTSRLHSYPMQDGQSNFVLFELKQSKNLRTKKINSSEGNTKLKFKLTLSLA